MAAGQPGEGRRLAVPLTERDGRIAADHLSRLDVAHDTALAGDAGPGTDLDMVADGGVAANHHAITDDRAASDADLAAQHAVTTEPHVVRPFIQPERGPPCFGFSSLRLGCSPSRCRRNPGPTARHTPLTAA